MQPWSADFNTVTKHTKFKDQNCKLWIWTSSQEALACGPTLSPYSLLNKIKLHVPAWLFLTIHCSTVNFRSLGSQKQVCGHQDYRWLSGSLKWEMDYRHLWLSPCWLDKVQDTSIWGRRRAVSQEKQISSYSLAYFLQTLIASFSVMLLSNAYCF